MSLIKKPYELAPKLTIAAMVYGQAGQGKTTLACSAPSPVLLDFDGGVSRLNAEHQVPTVQITSWNDVTAVLTELANDGGEYKTIICDTVSKMIDCITSYVCGNAQPKIQDWGKINSVFKTFLRNVRDLGKNIVFVAQREVEKDDEVTRYVPQVRASNYKDIICDLDICGYLEMRNVKGTECRVITFDGTSRNEGKNTGGFEASYIIPQLKAGEKPHFFTDIFSQYLSHQQEVAAKRAEEAKTIEESLSSFREEVDGCADADSLNGMIELGRNLPAIGNLRVLAGQYINTRAKALGLQYDKTSKSYVAL